MDEIKAVLDALPPADKEKLQAAFKAGGSADNAAAAAEDPMAAFMAMIAHRGDYEAQRESFGPAPDFADPKAGWYWYGQDGSTGPELAPESGEKPDASDRSADVFYIHPTSYLGALWNMPLADKEYSHATDFYVATEVSAFNGSCRVFVPKFRQAAIAAMAPHEDGSGKLATELAYADVKQAFEHYLADENKGRPFILASHSQGSLYSMRLMLDLIEGKPLFSQFIACYGFAAWAPLSLFEGETAVFKQIKLCQSPTDVGCFISWTCEHPDTVKKHGEVKDSKKPGDWYPATGHKIGENEWRLAHGEPIVCTDPLTWTSNGLGDPEAVPQRWLGMLDVVAGTELQDMDTVLGMYYAPSADIELKKIARMIPDDVFAKLGDGDAKVVCEVDKKTGDLQVPPLPPVLAGSSTESFEHMNIILFWFNIRENVAARVQAMAG